MILAAHFVLIVAATACAAFGCWVPVAIIAFAVLLLAFSPEIRTLLGSLSDHLRHRTADGERAPRLRG